MGAVIRGARARIPDGSAPGASSIDLAGNAARELLERCGIRPEDVDLVVNAGIYRDEAICEPALAPQIQRAHLRRRDPHDPGAFAFDVANGGCGMVSAFQIVDAFLRAGTRRLGLVVASDVDPTPGLSRGYRFEPCGAAILLEPGARGAGFTAFHSESFGKYADLFEARGEWIAQRSATGLVIHESEEYAARCADCAAAALGRFLARQRLARADVDLLIASSSPAGFAAKLAEAAGLPAERVVAARAHAHTAGPALALASALASPDFRGARNLLFATVGAGITVSLALYRDGLASRRLFG